MAEMLEGIEKREGATRTREMMNNEEMPCECK